MTTTTEQRVQAMATIIAESSSTPAAWERARNLFPHVTDAELDAAFQQALSSRDDGEGGVHAVQDERHTWAVVDSRVSPPNIIYSRLSCLEVAELARADSGAAETMQSPQLGRRRNLANLTSKLRPKWPGHKVQENRAGELDFEPLSH